MYYVVNNITGIIVMETRFKFRAIRRQRAKITVRGQKFDLSGVLSVYTTRKDA